MFFIMVQISAMIFVVLPVQAAGSAEWVDNATILYEDRLFRDTEIDNDWNFFSTKDPDGCPDIIKDLNYNPDDINSSSSRTPSDTKVTLHERAKGGGSCEEKRKDEDITLTKASNAQLGFRWVDQGTIESVDGRRQFKFDSDEKIYINSTNEDNVCRDYLEKPSADNNTVVLVVKRSRLRDQPDDEARRNRLRGDYQGYTFVEDLDYHQETNDGKCISSDPLTVKVSESKRADGPAGTGTSTAENLDEKTDAETCASEGGALSWIMCSMIELLDEGFQYVDKQIGDLLIVPEGDITGTNAESVGVPLAAKQIRNIAYIILIPIMLVMVISTALGFDFVSAYTIKKALPRMVFAIIFIAISSDITLFLVRITNTLGVGIAGLILGPFDIGSGGLAHILNPASAGGVSIMAALFGLGAILVIGPAVIGILLSYLLVAFIAVLMGFAILAFRQGLVIVLSLLAPLAILAWIFPGNDKLWKLWWGTFTKLLLMYPMVILLITSGKVMAKIVYTTQGGAGGSPMGVFIAITVYIAPYFLIPKTFQWAGGVFASISGMAANRGAGFFNKQKEKRGEHLARGLDEFYAGERQNRFASRLGERVGVGTRGAFGFGGRGQQARAQKRSERAAQKQKSESMQALALNSDDATALMHATGGRTDMVDSAQAELQEQLIANGVSAPEAAVRAEAAARRVRAVGVNRSNAQAAGTLLMQNKARSVAGGQVGRDFIDRGIARMHGADTQAAEEHRGTLQYFAREGGRSDLGGDSSVGGFDRTGAYKSVRGHTTALQETANALTADYQESMARGDEVGAIEASAKMAAMRNALGPDVTEENKAIVTAMLQGVGVDIGNPQTVDQQLAANIESQRPLIGPAHPGWEQAPYQTPEEISSHIRNRAGLYEQGDRSGQQPPGPATPTGP